MASDDGHHEDFIPPLIQIRRPTGFGSDASARAHEDIDLIDERAEPYERDSGIEDTPESSPHLTPLKPTVSQDDSSNRQQLSDSDPDDSRPLKDLLRKQKVRSSRGDRKEFWPLKLLLQIISRGRLERELRRYQSLRRDVGELVDIIRPIRGDGRPGKEEDKVMYIRVFALLLLLDHGSQIENFIDEGVSDEILPVCTRESAQGGVILEYRKNVGSTIRLCELRPALSWPDDKKEYFEERQWRMRPPFFDFKTMANHYDFDGKSILPWCQTTTDESERRSSNISEKVGAYGVVTQVQIDPNSHRFHPVLNEVRS